ncbi:MAG TPA: hypothetical protein PLB05_10160 [Candidatus Omnitrophota bacterium]|nr:hypothetical protein [Candidatus Omnitrophota bacterium]HPN56752.1 hypothetical protein [Candidatus Omnitrophota bacterium]
MIILITGLLVGVSERVIAWRWLRAETQARGEHFVLWATLTVVFPLIGLPLYLLFRSHARLFSCPHCQSPSPEGRPRCLHCGTAWPASGADDGDALSWKFPDGVVVPLAAIAAVAMRPLFASLRFYDRQILLRPGLALILIGVTYALLIGIYAWILVKTQRAGWQNNPLPLLTGVTLALATIVRLGGIRSGGMVVIAAGVLVLAIALVMSASLHLAVYDVRRTVMGLALGWIVAVITNILAMPYFGITQFPMMILLIAPFMLAAAALSLRARFVRGSDPRLRVAFLQVAAPLWGLLGIALLMAFLANH